MSAQDNDIRITFNLNELVEIRAKLLSQGEDYSKEISKGEWLDADDIDEIAVDARTRLTWDALYFMIDDLILELSLIHISEPTRPERIGYGGVWV